MELTRSRSAFPYCILVHWHVVLRGGQRAEEDNRQHRRQYKMSEEGSHGDSGAGTSLDLNISRLHFSHWG
jgi:hypothetical protein